MCVSFCVSYLEVYYVRIAMSPTTAMQYHQSGNFLSALRTFASHFPKKSQYLVNGESDQKSDTNKKDVKCNFLSGVLSNLMYTVKPL